MPLIPAPDDEMIAKARRFLRAQTEYAEAVADFRELVEQKAPRALELGLDLGSAAVLCLPLAGSERPTPV